MSRAGTDARGRKDLSARGIVRPELRVDPVRETADALVRRDERSRLGHDARVLEVGRARPVRRGKPLIAESGDREGLPYRAGRPAAAELVTDVTGLALDAPHLAVEVVEPCDAPVQAGRGLDPEDLRPTLVDEPTAQIHERAERVVAARPDPMGPAERAVVDEGSVLRARERGGDHEPAQRARRRRRTRPRSPTWRVTRAGDR